jgi:hypothetical protein
MTRMRPASLSATNRSPFGAVRISRGSLRPEAKRLTSKPFGTIGFWSLRCTILTTFRTDWAGSGAGKSCGLISLRVPGWSERQSPNAVVPSMGPDPVCANSGITVSETIPATDVAMIVWIGRCMRHSWQSPVRKRRGAAPGSGAACGEDRAAGAFGAFMPRRRDRNSPAELTLRSDCSPAAPRPFYNPFVLPVTRLDR